MTHDLRTLALQHLQANPRGLLLADLLDATGVTNDEGRKQLQIILGDLKQRRRIVTAHHATERGSLAVYRITVAGDALLEQRQRRAQLPPVASRTCAPSFEDEPVLRTGAMEFEQATVLRTVAAPGQLPPRVISSVFSLAYQGARS